MRDDDVPLDEMRLLRPHRDAIDAVMDDVQIDDDLADVAAIVHDLRSAYVSDEGLTRGPELAAFTGAHLGEAGVPRAAAAVAASHRASETERSHPMMKALGALTAGVAGKLALGTAVAAASVGGLHAADVVDVPGLPEQANERAVIATDEVPEVADEAADEAAEAADRSEAADEAPEAADAADQAREVAGDASEAADDAREAADEASAAADDAADTASEFSIAMQAWSDCVDAAAADHDDATAAIDASETAPPEAFDPEEACGPRPAHTATDDAQGPPEEIAALIVAVHDWSDCVVDNAPNHADACGANPAADRSAVGGAPEGTPAGPPDDTPAGPPEGTPAGPPEGTPAGPPEDPPGEAPDDTPAGPPEDPPGDAAEETPADPPAENPDETPDGPPEETPADPPAENPDETPDGPPEDAPTPGGG